MEVVTVAQEDESLDTFWRMYEELEGDLPFRIATDLGRRDTPRYDRITTYVLDGAGRVLEIFPAHRRMWMPWDAVLRRLDELSR